MFTAAEREYRAYQTVAEQRGDTGAALWAGTQVAIGYVLLARDTATAVRLLNDALVQYPLDRIAPFSRPYADLIRAAAVTGQVAQANRWLAEYRAARPDEVRNLWGSYLEGQIALSQHKAREAAAGFRQMGELSYCNPCGAWELGLALDEAGVPDSALAAYEMVTQVTATPYNTSYLQWALPPSLRRLGELYETRGDRARALEYYGRFMDLWRNADPPLQPAVRDVKARMARLAGEGH
jgi:tetratricopeptide (TPR) repeat protein